MLPPFSDVVASFQLIVLFAYYLLFLSFVDLNHVSLLLNLLSLFSCLTVCYLFNDCLFFISRFTESLSHWSYLLPLFLSFLFLPLCLLSHWIINTYKLFVSCLLLYANIITFCLIILSIIIICLTNLSLTKLLLMTPSFACIVWGFSNWTLWLVPKKSQCVPPLIHMALQLPKKTQCAPPPPISHGPIL